jgi:tryptophan synthase alpha chain
MSRIAETFAKTKAEGRAALVGYLTAYDPDREGSLERLRAACGAGLDVLELGVPFSDPTADGPDVQGAMIRALESGGTVAGSLEIVRELRRDHDLPIVLFSYANPLLQYGPDKLATDAAEAGVDALLVVDMPPEAASTLRGPAVQRGLDWIGLVAPTSSGARIAKVTEASRGFVYAVTLRGVTGAKLDVERPELAKQLAAIEAHTDLPVAAGFGIRTPEQASSVGRHAEGVVVGSALIRAAQQGVDALRELVAALRKGVATR